MKQLLSEIDVLKIRIQINDDMEKGLAAKEQDDISRAALYFWSALKEAQKLTRGSDASEDKDALAGIYAALSRVCDGQLLELSPDECAKHAGELWKQLYTETGDENYEEKRRQIMAAETHPEPDFQTMSDSPDDYAYLQQAFPYLCDIAVSLKYYDILVNDDGEVLIEIPGTHNGDMESAVLYYDGGEHALLFKGADTLIICDYINPDARKLLLACTEVLLFEPENPDDTQNEYIAKLIRCKDISKFANKLL